MGINYVDSVVIYNRYIDGLYETEQYFGTRFDNVRLEFTQEENQNRAAKENVSVCLLKIHNDTTLPKPYKDPMTWKSMTADERPKNFTLNVEGDFFVIVRKKELSLDIEVPLGKQESENPLYGGNFFEYMKGKYGYVYTMNSFASLRLIPHFQVGGR